MVSPRPRCSATVAGRRITRPLAGVGDRCGDGAAADEGFDGDRLARVAAAAVLDRVGHRLPGRQQDVGFPPRIDGDRRKASPAADVAPRAIWSSAAGTTVAKLRAELWHGRSANSTTSSV